jgi:hypothetical protein
MTATCPACLREERTALLCLACTATLRYELNDVPNVLADLDVTLAKMGRMEGGKAGLASERSGYHHGASDPGWVLGNVLSTWARDVCGEESVPESNLPSAVVAAHMLLSDMDKIRRHPAADELMDEVVDAIRLARRTTDRPANRTLFHVGPCPEDGETGPCPGEVFAFFPTEDSRPPRMECRENPEHRWASHQWYRTGERILRRMKSRKGAAA